MVKVLVLSPYPERILPVLETSKDSFWTNHLPPGAKPDWVVMYGHRQILKKPMLDAYKNRIINIHIGYLPWNRGASPNLWSWYDGTPSGVTIHKIDEGIDTGNILWQTGLYLEPNRKHTLASTYDLLHSTAAEILHITWPSIRDRRSKSSKQPKIGSYHTKAQTEELMKQFPLGWDTPIAAVIEAGKKSREEK